MKILITGDTGYIGSHTSIELINQGHEIIIVDNLINSKKSVLDTIANLTGIKPKFYQVDLTDQQATDQIFTDNDLDLVIHFAGLKAVAESVEKPLEYYRNNLDSTFNLLNSMQSHGVNKIIFSSSATVYGEQNAERYSEDMPTGTGITNPYGQTKFMIEQILQDIAVANPNFSAVILRYFNPVGAHPSGLLGEDPNGIPNNLMPVVTNVYRGIIPKLSIYGNDYPTADGTCERDFIHVVDLAKGHLAAIQALNTPGAHVYNLGTGQATSVKSIVEKFEAISGKPLPHQYVSRREGDLASICADPTKAQKELNWRTELTIDDAIRDTLNFINQKP